MKHLARSVAVGIALLWSAIVPLVAQVPSLGPLAPTAEQLKDGGPPMRLAERVPIDRPLVLRPASEGARDQLDALEAWNRAGKRPTRIGFSRPLPEPIAARFGRSVDEAGPAEVHAVRALSSSRSVVWATEVTVKDASSLRLHLTDVHLPSETRFWSYTKGGEPISFGMELLSPSGDLWTPSVFGETAFLEVEIPAGEASFLLPEVSETVAALGSSLGVSTLDTSSPSCLVDATWWHHGVPSDSGRSQSRS